MNVNASGTVRTWAVDLDSGSIALRGYDADGTMTQEAVGTYPGAGQPPAWIAFCLYLFQTGGTVTARLLRYTITGNADAPVMEWNDVSYSGTAGAPNRWVMEGSLGYNQGRLAHVGAYRGQFPFITFDFARAANGHTGETAAGRVTRLCAEENVQVVVEAGASESMGAQGPDTFLGLLYSCEDADFGVLYERGAGLGYRPRGARYNQPVSLALNFTPGDVAEPPEPVDDDQGLRNQVTVSRDGGSSATAADAASIARTGLIDEAVTLNLETDSRLADHANFRLRLYTVAGYRWPSVALNLARNTSQIRAWRAAPPFPRMTIANPPDQVAGVDIDLMVDGYQARYGPFGWDIDGACSPAQPWDVGVYDSTESRYDSATTTMSSTVAAGVTTLVLTFTNPADAWSVQAASQPYDLMISGEQVRVPIGGMGAVTGSGPYTQTVTGAVRAVNGIAKSLPAGAEVHVANPGRYAL
jgi:hypothetical protein